MGLVTLALAETAAAEVLLAVFMASILLVWAVELLDHFGILPGTGRGPDCGTHSRRSPATHGRRRRCLAAPSPLAALEQRVEPKVGVPLLAQGRGFRRDHEPTSPKAMLATQPGAQSPQQAGGAGLLVLGGSAGSRTPPGRLSRRRAFAEPSRGVHGTLPSFYLTVAGGEGPAGAGSHHLGGWPIFLRRLESCRCLGRTRSHLHQHPTAGRPSSPLN